VLAARSVHEEGHLQSSRSPKLAEHDAVLCWVGLDGDGVAGEGVGFCHLAGPGAEHGADWCCGGHCGVLYLQVAGLDIRESLMA
jgi:hypothetical protein